MKAAVIPAIDAERVIQEASTPQPGPGEVAELDPGVTSPARSASSAARPS